MERPGLSEVCSNSSFRPVSLLVLLLAVWALTACQGVSSGGSNGGSPQSGTISVNNSSLNFGSIAVGSSKSISTTATNSGSASLTINAVSFASGSFSLASPGLPLTIAAGQSAPISIAFAPSVAGTVNSSTSISSDASNPSLSISLTGTGTVAATQLAASPSTLSVGSVLVGSSGTASGTLTASGGSVTVTAASSDSAAFAVAAISFPVTIADGQSVPFSVTFSPQGTGTATATLTFTSDAQPSTSTESVTGNGTTITTTGLLTATPSTLGIGNVVVGSSGMASGSLSASGAAVTVTGATSNNSTFTLGGLSLPVTIPAGQSVPFNVTFSPAVTGAASATLTFSSNAQPPTTTDNATGSGTPAPTHSVSLSWTGSTSPNITGYNVYRSSYAGTCGSFAKINSVLNTGTLYTDSTVASGSSYCYAATAVNTGNLESAYSNIASNVHIPNP